MEQRKKIGRKLNLFAPTIFSFCILFLCIVGAKSSFSVTHPSHEKTSQVTLEKNHQTDHATPHHESSHGIEDHHSPQSEHHTSSSHTTEHSSDIDSHHSPQATDHHGDIADPHGSLHKADHSSHSQVPHAGPPLKYKLYWIGLISLTISILIYFLIIYKKGEIKVLKGWTVLLFLLAISLYFLEQSRLFTGYFDSVKGFMPGYHEPNTLGFLRFLYKLFSGIALGLYGFVVFFTHQKE